MADLPKRYRDHPVREILDTMWRTVRRHLNPPEGLPRPTPEQVDMIADEIENRYLPALYAWRYGMHRIPQPRARPRVEAGLDPPAPLPMSDTLDAMGLIADLQLGPPPDGLDDAGEGP